MAYQPVHHPTMRGLQPAHFDSIEMDTRYDPGNDKYAPPPGRSPSHMTDGDSKLDDMGDDKNPFFRSSSGVAQRSNWPDQAQQVATVTPLRAFLMFFDGVLASTPIMFVGKFDELLVYVQWT
jgi:hypothetical protein